MLFFFYGTLRSETRLRAVLGREGARLRREPAVLEGHEARYAPGRSYPLAVRRRGSRLSGILVDVPFRRMVGRLDRHEGAEYRIVRLPVRDHRGRVRRAALFIPRGHIRASRRTWDYDRWRQAQERAASRLGRTAREPSRGLSRRGRRP